MPALPLAVSGETGIGKKALSIGLRATLVTPEDADSVNWYGGMQARWHLSPGRALEGSIDNRRNDYYGDLVSVKISGRLG